MRRSAGYFFVLAGALLIVAVLMAHKPGTEAAKDGNVAASSRIHASDSGSVLPSVSAVRSPEVLALNTSIFFRFRSAETAAAASDLAQQSLASGEAVGYDMMAAVGASCANYHPSGPVTRARNENGQWVVDALRKYCETFVDISRIRQFVDNSRERGKSSSVRKELQKIEAANGPEAMIAAAEAEILAASDPYSLQGAAYYLSASGGAWSYGEDLPNAKAASVNLTRAQTLAIRLYACDLFGGCGSGQLLTLQECGVRGTCLAGQSLREILRGTTSPAEFSLAEAIEARLLSNRSQ